MAPPSTNVKFIKIVLLSKNWISRPKIVNTNVLLLMKHTETCSQKSLLYNDENPLSEGQQYTKFWLQKTLPFTIRCGNMSTWFCPWPRDITFTFPELAEAHQKRNGHLRQSCKAGLKYMDQGELQMSLHTVGPYKESSCQHLCRRLYSIEDLSSWFAEFFSLVENQAYESPELSAVISESSPYFPLESSLLDSWGYR